MKLNISHEFINPNFFSKGFAQTKKLCILYSGTWQKSKTYAAHVQTRIRLRTLPANRKECYLHKYSGILWTIPEYSRILWNIQKYSN